MLENSHYPKTIGQNWFKKFILCIHNIITYLLFLDYGEEAVEALHVPGSGNSSTFAFQIQSSLTPIIDNIAIDEASKVMVNHNRGTFQGTNAPTFTFTGQGFSATPSENQIMIGDTSCTIITASETEINCTMSETLDGEATYLIKYFNEPNGYGIIGSNSFAKYSTVSYIDSISPVNGSKAGAGDLTITGKGFISQGINTIIIYNYILITIINYDR